MNNSIGRLLMCSAILISMSQLTLANNFEIGIGKPYASPNQLYLAQVVKSGDTISIDGGEYLGKEGLAIWTANDLLIRGVNGRPHLNAEGQAIGKKGIWIIAGNNIKVENIEFSHTAVPDKNGVGIRFEGINLSLSHCYFHHCENGLLTNNPDTGTIVIEYSEFAYSGYGDGYSHNLYIGHCDQLIFRYNYSHHSSIGHLVKSRATKNYIYCNRIMDEETGNSSRLIDLPNGGVAIIIGNTLMQGAKAENSNLIGYGLEGLTHAENRFYCVNNTLVNEKPVNGLFIDIAAGTDYTFIANNIFSGAGKVIKNITVDSMHNLVSPDINSMYFVNRSTYDYELTALSPAIDGGAALDSAEGYALLPVDSYVHPVNNKTRIQSGAAIDQGAFEFTPAISHHVLNSNALAIYPNPVRGVLYISTPGIHLIHPGKLIVSDVSGRIILQKVITDSVESLNTSNFPSGIYFVHFITSGEIFNATFICQN